MNSRLLHAVVFGLLFGLAAGVSKPAMAADELAAGIATIDITPPVGYRLAGYFYDRPSTDTHDPLHAKALVLRQGKERCALVSCDLLGVPREVTSAVRAAVEKRTGIPAAHVLIFATHTHTAPLYQGTLRRLFHERAAATQKGEDPQEKVDYAADLASKLVSVIGQADAAAKPAELAAGVAEQEGLSFNRRHHMKDGTVRFNPGPLNPDIARPAGPIDPQVGMLLVRDSAARRPVAMLANFALHLDTTGGTLYSADYPYYLEQHLRETLGKDFVLIYGTGTCGDINHIDVASKERRKADGIGAALGTTVQGALPSLKAIATPALSLRREIITVPLQKNTPEKLAWARQNAGEIGGKKLTFLEQVEVQTILSLDSRGSDTIALEVQALRLSRDVAIVTLPGEVFVNLGLAIKQASPFTTTLVIELAQDCPAYIPTKKAFAEGSYEIVNSRVAPGGGEALVQAAGRLLTELAK